MEPGARGKPGTTVNRGGKIKGKVFARGLVVLLFAGYLASSASAQSSWWRTYGDSLADNGRAVRQTADGGYIIGGSTASFGAGVTDVYLIKTNATGGEVWARVWGDTMEDGGSSVRQTADSGYIIAGYTGSYGAGGHDVWLIKTNALGGTDWTRTYGGVGGDQGNSVAPTADGGYIIAGYTWSFGAGNADVYLVKTNAVGDTDWTRAYGGTSGDEGYAVQQTADGGYIVAGVTHSFGAGIADVYLIKTNAAGGTVWTRTYGGTSNDEGYSVQQTADSGYIITGYTSSFGAGSQDVYLIKTNASGDTAWTRTFGGTGNDEGSSVQQTGDGGWVVAGSTASFGAGNADVYLVKTDASGYVGVAEEHFQPRARSREVEPTVVRILPRGAVAFDAMGRRVLHAKPGIYFVREAQAVRKVVLTR